VSHELRTPLNAMLGWARMLRTQTLDERRASRAVETIERNATVQAQLIDDLLDVSRVITGKLSLDITSLNLASVVESAIDSARPAADAKGIRIEAELGTEASTFLGDGNRLQQIAWNLLSNAIKFTPSGGAVHVTLRRTDGAVELRVADNGAGIAREFLPFVFDRFRQADSTTTRVHGGLGLGLAIVRHLVELHGGTVHADSEGVGKGATFIVRLPAVRAVSDEGTRRQAGREPLPDPAALAGVTVLVVDDHADARELVAVVLEQHGARIEAAGSVKEAVDILHRSAVDIVVADLGMPDEDGYALMKRLREDLSPHLRQIPAIALTAYVGDGDRRRTFEAGFVEHLAKPVEPGDLARAVADALHQQRTVS
jgi:CheY-like chemotaxis protein